MRTRLRNGPFFIVSVVAVLATAAPVFAAEKTAQEAAGGGQLIRKEADTEKAVNLCAGCLAPMFTEGSKSTITPYGRIELDASYSTRNTNPLDPSQFNGYGTAAGTSDNHTSTLNPRYSVFGIRADRTDGKHVLTGTVEVDFYGETDNATNLLPRLRLAYLKFSPNNNTTSITIGQDWNPIMGLLSDNIDFSIMGYTGNLWQRIPQITVRHNFTDNVEGLFTVMRFERGLSNCCGRTQVRPNDSGSTGGGPTNLAPFNDPVQMPYVATRLAYNGAGSLQGTMVAANLAYRWYRSAPIPGQPTFQSGNDINSYVLGLEAVHQVTKQLKVMGELAYGQALGNEWFRWNQDLNLTTGNEIRALTGWLQLSYAHSRDYTFLAGYGWDNPLNSDLNGSITFANTGAPVNSNVQYLSNQRTYFTAIHPVWSDLFLGFEWQHFWTHWAGPVGFNQPSFQADMFTLSTWYNF
jgi:hypothetical protein